jgi:hypothetical protein
MILAHFVGDRINLMRRSCGGDQIYIPVDINTFVITVVISNVVWISERNSLL